MLASFSWLMKVQVWNLTVFGRHQSPRSLSLVLQRNRGFEVLCVLLLLSHPVDQGWLFHRRQESSLWLLSSCLLGSCLLPRVLPGSSAGMGLQGSLQILANSSVFWCALSFDFFWRGWKDLKAVDLSWITFPLPGSFRGHWGLWSESMPASQCLTAEALQEPKIPLHFKDMVLSQETSKQNNQE